MVSPVLDQHMGAGLHDMDSDDDDYGSLLLLNDDDTDITDLAALMKQHMGFEANCNTIDVVDVAAASADLESKATTTTDSAVVKNTPQTNQTDKANRIKYAGGNVINTYDICDDCGIKMHLMNGDKLHCPSCASLKKVINDEMAGYSMATNQYNSGPITYCKIISGRGTSTHIIPSSTDRLHKMVKNAKRKIKILNGDNQRFPPHFIEEAAHMMSKIQSNGRILKDNMYKAMLTLCLSQVCKKHRVYQKSLDLCKYTNVNQTDMTKCTKIMTRLHNRGIVEYERFYDPRESNFTQYFTILNIPMKYKSFGVKLIDLANPRNMKGVNNNTVDSKCAAIVSILQRKLKLNFTDADVCRVCNIVQSTYEKFTTYCVRNYKTLNPLFEEYGIPPLIKREYRVSKSKKGKRKKKKAGSADLKRKAATRAEEKAAPTTVA